MIKESRSDSQYTDLEFLYYSIFSCKGRLGSSDYVDFYMCPLVISVDKQYIPLHKHYC